MLVPHRAASSRIFMEIEPTAKVVAIEKDKARLGLIRENLNRLKQAASCFTADAADLKVGGTGTLRSYSVRCALLASGVIRRHPDIKLLRAPTDIPALSKEQLRILTALWQTLTPAGCWLCNVLHLPRGKCRRVTSIPRRYTRCERGGD